MNPTVIAAFLQSALQAILSLIQQTKLSTSGVAQVLAFLVQIVPVLGKLGQDLVVPVQNIIAALSDQPEATEDQIKALDELNVKVDADWGDAVKNYLSNHGG